jgi:hypothetical protein
MSYDVLLLRKEVKELNSALDFLENPELIPHFTLNQYSRLKNFLIQFGYHIENEQAGVITFNFKGGLYGITAALFSNQLSLKCAGFSEEGIFEISQTASELTDNEIVKLDLQTGSWEQD